MIYIRIMQPTIVEECDMFMIGLQKLHHFLSDLIAEEATWIQLQAGTGPVFQIIVSSITGS